MVLGFFSQKTKQTIKRVYLDNAGATALNPLAKKAMEEVEGLYGNPSAIHHEGARAGQILDKARALCARVLNAHAYEIYFVGSGTESCNLAVFGTYEGFAKDNQGIIPHMIVSQIEHPAVLESVKFLERNKKITVTYLPVYEEGIVKIKDLKDALTDNTILVSVMYANNEIGTFQPVKEIGRLISEWKTERNLSHVSYPYFHIDACQAANYASVDVVRLKAHLVTVNSSKVYGPKGSALLYKREGVIIRPLSYGGGQERELRSGTENLAGAYGFAVALSNAFDTREEESLRLRILREETIAALTKSIETIVFYGCDDEYFTLATDARVIKHERHLPNNINCRVPGISSEEMILRLDALGYAVSHKSACASMETDGSYVVMALGATEEEAKENVRISMGRYTTKEDMKGFVEAMTSIVKKYSK